MACLQLVMQFLYNGGCDTLEVDHNDVLELMAAANFFQLDGLLRFCEAQCSDMVDLDNIVSMYIHAKVSVVITMIRSHLFNRVDHIDTIFCIFTIEMGLDSFVNLVLINSGCVG